VLNAAEPITLINAIMPSITSTQSNLFISSTINSCQALIEDNISSSKPY
jgi:hypothetical protein